MTEVETDLETLKEQYTPKQRENFDNHLKPKLQRLDKLSELAEAGDGDPEAVAEAAELGKEWFLRTYRPKKRGDGLMERDHVQIGEPEHYFKKWLGKLNNPWGSIQGLMMAQFGISSDEQDRIERAATAVWVADKLKDANSVEQLQRLMEEHEKVGKLYGVE